MTSLLSILESIRETFCEVRRIRKAAFAQLRGGVMNNIEAKLRTAHDTLNCRVRPDGRAFKTVDDYERDASEIMHVCWHAADCIAALKALARELAVNLKAAEIAVNAYGCQTPVGFIADECDALAASIKRALSHPLVSELIGVTEGGE